MVQTGRGEPVFRVYWRWLDTSIRPSTTVALHVAVSTVSQELDKHPLKTTRIAVVSFCGDKQTAPSSSFVLTGGFVGPPPSESSGAALSAESPAAPPSAESCGEALPPHAAMARKASKLRLHIMSDPSVSTSANAANFQPCTGEGSAPGVLPSGTSNVSFSSTFTGPDTQKWLSAHR